MPALVSIWMCDQSLSNKFINCDGGILCSEGIVNIFKIRKYYKYILIESGCKIEFNSNVTSIISAVSVIIILFKNNNVIS